VLSIPEEPDRPAVDLDALRVWLQAEYAKARTAARAEAVANQTIRQREGHKAVPCFHASAISRMCALGAVLQRLAEEVPSC
jgi:hypothetical protein